MRVNYNEKDKRRVSSKWFWGTVLMLSAAFILSNQLGGFIEIGIGSIIAALLAIAVFVQCIAHLNFAPLPIPIAALYYIFQIPLGFPYLRVWTLIVVALLTAIALSVLLPHKHHWHGEMSQTQLHTDEGGDINNPYICARFGAVSRYLHSDSLETARLECRFGAMEVYFDQAQISPDGAKLICNCSFGAIEIFVPRNWRVVDRLNCTLGGVDHKSHHASLTENSPLLTISGNVTFGGLEIRYV